MNKFLRGLLIVPLAIGLVLLMGLTAAIIFAPIWLAAWFDTPCDQSLAVMVIQFFWLWICIAVLYCIGREI